MKERLKHRGDSGVCGNYPRQPLKAQIAIWSLLNLWNKLKRSRDQTDIFPTESRQRSERHREDLHVYLFWLIPCIQYIFVLNRIEARFCKQP